MAAIHDYTQAVQNFSASLATDLQGVSDAVFAELVRTVALLPSNGDPVIEEVKVSLGAARDLLWQGLKRAMDTLKNEVPVPDGGMGRRMPWNQG